MRQKSTTDKNKYYEIIDSLNLEEVQKNILKTVWLDYLLLMNNSAKKGWFSHNYSQLIIIVLGLLIPIIEGSKLNYDLFQTDSNISVISVLGLIVAGLTTLNRQIGFEEKWRHYRNSAEAIRNEGDDFFALAGGYEIYSSHKEAFKIFIKTITSFKRQEVNNYMQEEKKSLKEK